MTVTDMIGADAAAVPAARPEADDLEAPRPEPKYRARFWRLALGALGLFWVCAFLFLVR